MEQEIIRPGENYRGLEEWIRKNCPGKLLLVCGRSIRFQTELNAFFESLGGKVVRFSGFQPNPRYESVTEGVALFRKENCCAVVGVGGGSAMDVAKCIKLFAEMEGDGTDGGFLKQPIVPNRIPFLAVPTTAGTGSEMTPFTIISDANTGMKWPLIGYEMMPEMAIVDADNMMKLPPRATQASGYDVLTHAVEAYVSTFATDYTDGFAKTATELVFKWLPKAYRSAFKGAKPDPVAREKMADASALAGIAFANAFLGINHWAAGSISRTALRTLCCSRMYAGSMHRSIRITWVPSPSISIRRHSSGTSSWVN